MRQAVWIFVWILLLGTALLWGSSAEAAQPVARFLPDLTPTRLELVPATANPGDSVRIVATVANRGLADAESFWVLLRVNDRILHSRLVSELKAREEILLEVPWVVAAGRQTIQIEVDNTRRIEEVNEDNNTLSLQLLFGADLALTNFALAPEHPKPGQPARIQATIRNLGVQDVQTSFAVQFLIGRRPPIATRFLTAGLKGGEEQTLETQWVAEQGEQLIRVVIDPFNAVSESDEVNNVFTRIINVSALEPTGADLTVRDLQINPSSPQAGQATSLRATVLNQGQGMASGFQVSFQIDGETIQTAPISTLTAGQTIQVTASWVAETGERQVRVKVDSTAVIPELDEENNTSTLRVDVGPPLNRCGQFAFLNIEEDAIPLLIALTGLGAEEVRNAFLPQMKRVMEEQYRGINIRFTFSPPTGRLATVVFSSENQGSILGRAPLGLRFGRAQVFLGSFLRTGSLLGAPLHRVAVILATVASHELGHLLGLNHTSQNNSNDIMSANADLSPAFSEAVPRFTPEAFQQLQRLLPLECP